MKKFTLPLLLMAVITACTNHQPHTTGGPYSTGGYPYPSSYGNPYSSTYGYPAYPGSSYSAPSYQHRHEDHDTRSNSAPAAPAPMILPAPISQPTLSPADSQVIQDAVRNAQKNREQHEDRERRERESYNFMMQQNH